MTRSSARYGTAAATLALLALAACSATDGGAGARGVDAGSDVGSGGAAGAGGGSGGSGGSGGVAGAGGADAGAPGFEPTPGTQAAVDRTEPCPPAQAGDFRESPIDVTVIQACLPNYDVWGAVVCGGPLPACACDASLCLAGEAAKLVSGQFCVCLDLCTDQRDGARCGAADARRCIAVDDVAGHQVFICGGA